MNKSRAKCNMRRHGQHSHVGFTSMGSSSTQNLSSQRMQQNAGMSKYHGQQDNKSNKDVHKHTPPRAREEERWQWDRDTSRGSYTMPSYELKKGQESDGARLQYQGSWSDPEAGMVKRGVSKDVRDFPHEQDPRIALADTTLPHPLENLEQTTFLADVMKLTKEHEDEKDAEISRHRVRLGEITGHYKEKLVAIRARQASQRNDFLQRESLARRQSYQQLMLGQYRHTGLADSTGLEQNSAAYTGGQLETASYRERQQLQGSHSQGLEARGSYPGVDQGYNNSRGRYY